MREAIREPVAESRAERSEGAKRRRGRGETGGQGGPRSPSGRQLSPPSFAERGSLFGVFLLLLWFLFFSVLTD